jgi:hypothetical protein
MLLDRERGAACTAFARLIDSAGERVAGPTSVARLPPVNLEVPRLSHGEANPFQCGAP